MRAARGQDMTTPAQVWRAFVAGAFWLAVLYALFG
jgi:hypothetical protein